LNSLSDLYQEVILDHATNPRNYGVFGRYWRNLEKDCPCRIGKCDKKWKVYYHLFLSGDDYCLMPIFTTRYHFAAKDLSEDEAVYGPYELDDALSQYLASK